VIDQYFIIGNGPTQEERLPGAHKTKVAFHIMLPTYITKPQKYNWTLAPHEHYQTPTVQLNVCSLQTL